MLHISNSSSLEGVSDPFVEEVAQRGKKEAKLANMPRLKLIFILTFTLSPQDSFSFFISYYCQGTHLYPC